MPFVLSLVLSGLVVIALGGLWLLHNRGCQALAGLTKRSAGRVAFVTLTSVIVLGAMITAPVGAVTQPGPTRAASMQITAHDGATGTISGVITFSEAGVNNICVNVVQYTLAVLYSATTANVGGQDGSYSITGVTPGPYTLVIDPTCAGTYSSPYANYAQPTMITVSAGQTTTDNIPLVLGGFITGVVTHNESPVAGVCVGVTKFTLATTASDGSYTISNLYPGTYSLFVDPTCDGNQSSNYESQQLNGTVDVTAGSATGPEDFDLALGGAITGVVTYDGSPVSGVCLSVFLPGNVQTVLGATTAGDGSFAIWALPPGDWTVDVVPGCYGGATSPYATEPLATPAVVTAGQSTQEDISLLLAGSMSGTVSYSGTGVGGVCVWVTQNGGAGSSGGSTTALDGSYTITNLAPGSYTVEASPECDGNSTSPYADVILATFPTVAASETSEENIALVLGATITGTVSYDNAGVDGVCVTATGGGGPNSLSATTATIGNTAGIYAISNLPPGSFTVTADPTCDGTVYSPYAPDTYPSPVVLGTGGLGQANFALNIPAPYVPPAPPPATLPPGSYGSPTSGTTSSSAPTTLFESSNGASVNLTVPAGALGSGSTVSLYPITDESALPSPETGQSFVVAVAVSWTGSSSSSAPITMTITDASIKAGDTIYFLTSGGGYQEVGTATIDGTITITFTSDPVFVVTAPTLVQAALTVTTTSGTVGAALTLETTGGSGTGTVSYGVTNGTAAGCAVSGSSLSATSAGTCLVTATKAADATYLAVSSSSTSVTFTLTQAALTVTTTSGQVGTALTLETSGGSGTGAVTFTVTNGTASGCAVSGRSLSAQSAGTCLVTATKAGDSTYRAASSTATSVALALPARPATITVGFKAKSDVLGTAGKNALKALSKKLLNGASVTFTGYAKTNRSLAKDRAEQAANYLRARVTIHVTIKTATTAALNRVTVATTKQ